MIKQLTYIIVTLGFVSLGVWIPYHFLGSANSFSSAGAEEANVRKLSWRELKTYDYKNNRLPAPLKHKLDQPSPVKISGFAVPLEVSGTYTDHFLLVPGRAYCIHVPPPPPHLMIEVKMKKAVSVRDIRGPLSIEGDLELRQVQTQWGNASWYFVGHDMEIYETDDPKLLYDYHVRSP